MRIFFFVTMTDKAYAANQLFVIAVAAFFTCFGKLLIFIGVTRVLILFPVTFLIFFFNLGIFVVFEFFVVFIKFILILLDFLFALIVIIIAVLVYLVIDFTNVGLF